jgi:hypothetical protein
MGMIKDRIIEAEDERGVEALPKGWYVVDGSFHIGAGPFLTQEKAEKKIVSLDETAAYIDY